MAIKLSFSLGDIAISRRIKIIAAAIFLGTGFFAVFVIRPLWSQIPKSSNRFAEALKEEQSLKDQASATRAYINMAKEMRGNLEKLEGMLVDVQFPVAFVQFLENFAAENNLSIAISSPSPDAAKDEAVFRISLGGKSSDVARFLAKLESGPYLLKIEQIQAQRAGQDRISSNVFIRVLAK